MERASDTLARVPSKSRIHDLAVDVYGPQDDARPRLMFCHGAWVGSWIWEGFADWFAAQGYTCYTPTWRGHYDSKEVEDVGDLSVLDYVEDALSVARAISPHAVIGESMGGLIAQKVAEAHPDLKALVLMNSAPPFMVPASPKILKAQVKYLGDIIGNKPNTPQEEDYRALILNNTPEPDATEMYSRICAESGRALREMSFGRIKVDASKVRSPVYVVAGHLDVITPIKVHRRIAKMYDARLVEYPDMSHHTFSEPGWEKVAVGVDTWLKEQLPAKVS